MGLFDKFFTSKPGTGAGATEPPAAPDNARSQLSSADLEREALRLIDAGNAIEDQGGPAAAALQQYEAAVKLAPNLARAHLNRGNVILGMGDVEGAIAAYSAALEKNPDYAGAHYNIGNAYARSGRSEVAVRHYQQALALQADFVDAEVALGSAFDDLGRMEEAIESYRRALAIRPDYAEVYNNLGLAQRKLGRLDDAVASCRRALSIDPDSALAHRYLAEALQARGELEAAAASYRRAIELRPDDADARNNLGNTLKDLGQLEAAAAAYRELLKQKPDLAEVHNNLGSVLPDLEGYSAAIASFREALRINPGIANVHYNLGNALQCTGMEHAAIESFREAIRLDPANYDAHCNLGNALCRVGLSNEALASFRRTLELKPDHAFAHSNAGIALNDLGRADEAAASFREALRINPDFTVAQSNLLFCLNYRADAGAEAMFAEAVHFGELAARKARPFADWPSTPEPDRCLRVGLVSGDFRNHVVGHFLDAVLAAIAAAARGQLELYGYPTHFVSDDVTERIKASCQGWHAAIRLSDEAFAQRIRDDRIDVLLDLSGHSEHNRLSVFAWKPAPVQATWLGYLATTGVTAIDYVIADRLTLPESEQRFFTEKIWHLPECYICFTPPAANVQVTPLPASSNDHITFGSFNNLNKINDSVVALWARLLEAVPGSQLLIKGKQFNDEAVRQAMAGRFAIHGIGAQRLTLISHVPTGQHLYPFQRVDISLDPFPYQGTTTTVESLYMGVPVLTLAGKTFLSRQGVGLLTNAGLPEWIAADDDDYVARGAAHARDRNALATLRSGLRERVLTSPIFDAPRFAHHFERALRGMWQSWCRQQSGANR